MSQPLTGNAHISLNFLMAAVVTVAVVFRAASCQEHDIDAEVKIADTEYPNGVPPRVDHHCEPRSCK